jgi:hypothetical protein
VTVAVSSVLQTSAGRMIFADLNEKTEQRPDSRQERNSGRDNRKPRQGETKGPSSADRENQPGKIQNEVIPPQDQP